MKKKDFVTLVLSTAGGLLFALGMCMALVTEWEAFSQGVAVGAAGLAILLVMILVRRKMSGKPLVALNARAVGITLLGVAGALLLGVGMCLTMVWDRLVPGTAVGILGILLLLGLIPAIRGLE